MFFVTAHINGVPLKALIDTGATNVILSYKDAERLNLDPSSLAYNVRTLTANGEGRTAHVILADVRIGGVRMRNVQGLVNPKGKLSVSLVGMSFLRHARLRIEGGEIALYP